MADLSDNTNWFETDASNNKASPNGWPEGMMPSGVNDTARTDKGALKRFWNRINPTQSVPPSSGVWTFTTGNPAYPAAYVNGEVYCFKSGGVSIGGDRFQVNSLGPKPMLKGVEGTGYVAIGAGDIGLLLAPQLIYDSTLNGGAGAFLLLNPYLPLFGDGSGGVTTGGLIKTSYNGSGSGGVSIYATGGGIRSDAGGTALYLPNGNIVCQTIAVAGTDEGGAGSGVAIRCTSGAVQSDRFGTAFYAPNGNVVAQNITAMTTLVSDLESRCQELAARVASLESRLVRD